MLPSLQEKNTGGAAGARNTRKVKFDFFVDYIFGIRYPPTRGARIDNPFRI